MASRPPDTERDPTDDLPTRPPEESTGPSTGNPTERLKRATAGVLGAVLLVRGLRRRSLPGSATALLGGWLLYRALGGRDRFGRTLRARTPTKGSRDDRTVADGATTVSRSVTIGRPADELYEAWRDPEQFSQVVGHFADVTPTDGDRYRWTVRAPGDRDVSWETRFVEEEPGEFLRWETADDAALANSGTVRFRPAPGDRGTVVTLTVELDPPGGALGSAALRRIDVVPEALVGTALGRFKSLAETGEVQTLAANPSARGRGDLL